MIQLLLQQHYVLFITITFALIFSLTFHEYGHGKVASLIGDDTAERAGRLTLNPIPHIDPLGLLMVLLIGIGYAKPVPTDPRKFNTRWGMLMVAAAGPGMNLLLAVVTINLYVLGFKLGIPLFKTP
jgi:Zn-dependent protease